MLGASLAQAQTYETIAKRNIHPGKRSVGSSIVKVDQRLVSWMKSNVSPETLLPYSFQIPLAAKRRIYENMGGAFSVPGIIERVIVEEGLIIYDGAVRQIVLAMLGGAENIEEASRLVHTYWNGDLRELFNIRAGYPFNNFVYDPQNPDLVSSNMSDHGKRGFIFRIINANGRYNTEDPLDGKIEFSGFPTWPTIHWEDWKPIAGENAWVTMAALQILHKKYFDGKTGKYASGFEKAIEFQLAEELARAAMILQTENGGIRMAPIGTYMSENDDGHGWYDLISTENNLSWYGAFRMLYEITGKDAYKETMKKMEGYFKAAWNAQGRYFYQGMAYRDGAWQPAKEDFATDVQTWGIVALGPKALDNWFGEGAANSMWQAAKNFSGARDGSGKLLGVGFTTENNRLSVEWTAGAIFAARLLAEYYKEISPELAKAAFNDAVGMREGIETLRFDLAEGKSAYSYSSRRGWIPFGWYSHSPDVLSLASTAWVVLVDAQFNPFYLPQSDAPRERTDVALFSAQ